MDYNVALEYYSAITVIEAQRYLIESKIASICKMTPHQIKSILKDFKKIAHPQELQNSIEFDEFIKRMKDGR